jgi:predicted NAD/FAD-dependent oxidoreductase
MILWPWLKPLYGHGGGIIARKKIAVVGGGVTGLSCAYELDKSGNEIVIYERDFILGGRSPHTNQIVTPRYEEFLELMDELGIRDEVLDEIDYEKMGALIDGEIRSFTGFIPFLMPEDELSFIDKYLKRPVLSRLMGIDVDQVRELKSDIRDINFDYEEPGEKARELAEISAEEWLNSYPENVQEKVLYPVMRTLFVNDLSDVCAEEAANHFQEFYDSMTGTMRTVSGGPTEIAGAIHDNIKAEIRMSSEVENVEEYGEGVVVETGEDSEEFDYVVLATPLPSSETILDTEFGMEYDWTEAMTVDGELEGEFANVIGAERSSNLRVLFAPSDEHFVFPETMGEDPDLDELYEEYSVLGREEIISKPLIEPGYDLPDLRHSERIFLAGDFYRYSGLETAVYTGRKVGRMINGE